MNRHLTAGQKALLQAELEALQRRYSQQLQTHQEGHGRVTHAHEVLQQDGDDAPQRAMDREVDLAITDMDTVALADVNIALKRLQAGDYGLCRDCEAEIPFDRLKVEPQALRCVTCAARRERL